MRRADRLFRLVQLLRGRKSTTTASRLADQLGVSERTVYRDIRDLVLAGTPIDGEAGVGYRLRPGFDLPPLMFDREEIQALVLGARIVARFGDARLARASDSILAKVAAILPKELEPLLAETPLFVPPLSHGARSAPALQASRDALVARRKIRMSYTDEAGVSTERTVRPLGVFFWGRAWTLAAWCELRQDFRDFRLDRVRTIAVLEETFADEPGRTLRDLLARYGPEAIRLLD